MKTADVDLVQEYEIRIVWCNKHLSGDARTAHGKDWRCHAAMMFGFWGCDAVFALLTPDTNESEGA